LLNKQWIVARQHQQLDDLILGRHKYTVPQCCTKFSLLANKTTFIESHKVLSHNDYLVAEFVKALREKPKYMAYLLVKSEKLLSSTSQFIPGVENQLFSTQQIIPVLFQSLYGNCIFAQDELLCLQLLKHLIEMQFTQDSSDLNFIDLRRLIRKQSCSFNVLFKFYTAFSFSAKLFLTAALYEPITQILTDEWYLDVDADKAMGRFSADELTSRFGPLNSKEYKAKTQKYREKIVAQLYQATMTFIDSINASMFCFPPSLAWLVNQLYSIVNKSIHASKLNNQTDVNFEYFLINY
jgi:hypothetical protein